MPSLPRISGGEAVGALQRLGFVVTRQNGSHIIMRRGGKGCVVPRRRELQVGTLASALRQAGVSVEEFIAALKNS